MFGSSSPDEVLPETAYWLNEAASRRGDAISGTRVQALLCGDRVEDLVISDSPVLTPAGLETGLNPSQGVALGDATGAGMPIGPRMFMRIHDVSEVVELQPAQVASLNSLQARVRLVQMFRRPPASVAP